MMEMKHCLNKQADGIKEVTKRKWNKQPLGHCNHDIGGTLQIQNLVPSHI